IEVRPTHPGDPGFWSEFEQILDLQRVRRQGDLASDHFDVPKLFTKTITDVDGTLGVRPMTAEEAAQSVRADWPHHFPTLLTQQFLKEGAKVDPTIIPQHSQDDFVNGPVMLAELAGWAVSKVSPSAFAAKWSEGRIRPEAVAWAIHTGELVAPSRIRDKVAALELTSPESFTAYEEGCPRHPAWPAMHSAASTSSLYLGVVLDLTPEQMTEARRLDYAVAASRSLAGVHYDTDNRAGLTLGQEVLARSLPEYLHRRFGAAPDRVREKIEALRYDWYRHEAHAEAPASGSAK
ncbi:MAG: hypothetical protein AAF658_05330, partial [Myxococcota bacterium]